MKNQPSPALEQGKRTSGTKPKRWRARLRSAAAALRGFNITAKKQTSPPSAIDNPHRRCSVWSAPEKGGKPLTASE